MNWKKCERGIIVARGGSADQSACPMPTQNGVFGWALRQIFLAVKWKIFKNHFILAIVKSVGLVHVLTLVTIVHFRNH